jgi:hypothetical protein
MAQGIFAGKWTLYHLLILHFAGSGWNSSMVIFDLSCQQAAQHKTCADIPPPLARSDYLFLLLMFLFLSLIRSVLNWWDGLSRLINSDNNFSLLILLRNIGCADVDAMHVALRDNIA